MGYTSRFPQIAAELRPRVDAAAAAAAEVVVQGAQERVPVRTGKLRAAIHAERTAEGYMVVAGDNEVFYGHIVEHGGNNTAPRPFLIPALEASRAEIRAILDRTLRGIG